MDLPSRFQRLIAGQAGPPGRLACGVLRPASLLYALAMRLRNRWYDRGGSRVARVGVPVVSVGNITTGGTGKTPLVIEVCRRLSSAGLRPAVVSRGYRAGPGGQADELLLLRRRLPDVPCVADPDRVAGARRAVHEHGANVIVLDDGFQHRRIGRDLDIVVVDATCPFGYGYVLPRGLLREPLSGLRRASLIVISRVDQVDAPSLQRLESALDAFAPGVPRVRAVHRPAGLVRLDGVESPLSPADLGPSYCFAAIGNPGSFRQTVASLGIDIAGVQWFSDHHHYREGDLAALQDAAQRIGAAALLTTEKDAVKLGALDARGVLPVLAVRIEIDFRPNDDRILTTALDRAVQTRRGVHEPTPIPTR